MKLYNTIKLLAIILILPKLNTLAFAEGGGIDGGGGGIQQLVQAQCDKNIEEDIISSLQFWDIERDLRNPEIAEKIPDSEKFKLRQLIPKIKIKIVKNPPWQKKEAPFLVAYSFVDQLEVEVDPDQYHLQVSEIKNQQARREFLRALGFHELMRLKRIEKEEEDYHVTVRYLEAIQYTKSVLCKESGPYIEVDEMRFNASPDTSCVSSSGVLWKRMSTQNGNAWLDTSTSILWYTPVRTEVDHHWAQFHCSVLGLSLPAGNPENFKDNDFERANENGLREVTVLKNLQIWTSTISKEYPQENVYIFNGSTGELFEGSKRSNRRMDAAFCIKKL